VYRSFQVTEEQPKAAIDVSNAAKINQNVNFCSVDDGRFDANMMLTIKNARTNDPRTTADKTTGLGALLLSGVIMRGHFFPAATENPLAHFFTASGHFVPV
jgi:hypothetical protein